MNKLFKLGAIAAAALAFGSAYAGIGQLNGAMLSGDGSVGNPYDFGMLTSTPSLLTVTTTGTPGSPFDEYANFTIGAGGVVGGAGNTYTLTFGGVDILRIDNLQIEVWDATHPSGNHLYASFAGDNLTHSFVLPSAGQYHVDISGAFGASASVGQYSLSLAAVPEPETYALMVGGLGVVGFIARRRKIS